MMKKSTAEQVNELTTPLPPEILNPNTEADMMLLAPADITRTCQNYGQVVAPSGSPDPSNYFATGKGVETASVKGTSTAILREMNFRDEELMKSLNCELVSETTGSTTKCGVRRIRRSQHEISYQPNTKGLHQLHITVDNRHIRGSPFKVAVKSPVENIGVPVLTIGEVNGPWGVAVNWKGEIIVTEASGHCVSVFSPSGKKLLSFGVQGTGRGHLNAPHGVAVDAEGNILVADCKNNRIQKFTASGTFLMEVKGTGPSQFSYPTDITINSSNNKVYVMDMNKRCVQVLNPDLTFSSTFGNEGGGMGQFVYPCGIAHAMTGEVYVADTENHRIQVFDARGDFLRSFGTHGKGGGQLGLPHCLVVDTNGMVYVSEASNNRVSVFTSAGQFVKSFGRKGDGPGEFQWPRGLAVDAGGLVYVCDCANNRIQAF